MVDKIRTGLDTCGASGVPDVVLPIPPQETAQPVAGSADVQNGRGLLVLNSRPSGYSSHERREVLPGNSHPKLSPFDFENIHRHASASHAQEMRERRREMR